MIGLRRWAAAWACLLGGLGAAWASVELPPDTRAGDLIFREGTEAVSMAVMAVDQGAYTHVGMLVGEAGHWQVLHATPSEVAGRADGVVLDDLSFFLDAARARRYAVYQVEADTPQRHKAEQAALAMLGRPFRIADEHGTYCTTLMWSSWQSAGVDLDVRFTSMDLPLLAGSYLLPSALMASPRLHLLGQDEVAGAVPLAGRWSRWLPDWLATIF